MPIKLIITLTIMIFTAIGVVAQNGYKTATEQVKIGGKNISVSGNIYVNIMPRIIDDNQKIDCAKNGNLIAPMMIETVDKKKLPSNLTVKQIWIKNNNIWQKILFNREETESKESAISTVARACPSDKFDVDKEIIAVVELKYKGKTYFVRSSQNKLFITQ